jgi:hypothetical protein
MMMLMHLTSTNYFPQRNTTGTNSTQMPIPGSELSIQTQSKQNRGLFVLPVKHTENPMSNLMEPELQGQTDITQGIDTLVRKEILTGLSNSTLTNSNR